MSSKKLYLDMTRITLLLIRMNGILDAAFHKMLTRREFEEEKEETLLLAGRDEPHAAMKTPMLPFLESFFSDLGRWLDDPGKADRFLHYINVINGLERHETEAELAVDSQAAKHAPQWYPQLLEAGKAIVAQSGPPEEKSSERIGGLMRNIPADSLLGLIAHEFLLEHFRETRSVARLEKCWAYLNGEKPLRFKVSVKGTFVWIEY